MNITELSEVMKNGGIVGAGGAGFPSYAKLNEKANTIILNCAECEPMLRLHRQLLARRAPEIMTALSEVMQAVGASEAIIAIKSSYTQAIEAVREELPNFSNISMRLLPRVYPAGDEIVAIYEATGKRVEAGKLPISVGVIVYNVETMFNIYNAIKYHRGVSHKYVTVAGEVSHPLTVRVPLGMSFPEVIALAGGPAVSDYKILVGGPMTGRLGNENESVTKTTNALVLLPSDSVAIRRREVNLNVSMHRAMSACCQCHYCTDMCPRHLMGYPIDPARLMRAVATNCADDPAPFLNSNYCSGCNLCEMYSCFQGLNPKSIIAAVRAELKKNNVAPGTPVMHEIDPMRDGKRVSTQRIIARLGLSKYEVDAPYTKMSIAPEQVKILLSQGIGAPAVPCVKAGDSVKLGQKIADPQQDALSVALHSSMTGVVTAVTPRHIIISKEAEQ